MLSRNIVSSCTRHTLSSFRSLATEATVASTSAAAVHPPKRPPKTEIRTAIILNRSPIITRTKTAFESAYYAYQGRIRRALHNPFPEEFYFKPGSLIEPKFVEEERLRERRAFGPKFGIEEEKEEKVALTAMELAEQSAQEEEEGTSDQIASRTHASDKTGDVHSLDRKGKRNMYLILKTNENGREAWRFPEGDIRVDETLHQAAQRDLHAECGVLMDTWIVGRVPIGVWQKARSEADALRDASPKESLFFFKAHIMAGQVRTDATHVKDFAWLTKQEIKSRVGEEYWNAVHEMLTDY